MLPAAASRSRSQIPLWHVAKAMTESTLAALLRLVSLRRQLPAHLKLRCCKQELHGGAQVEKFKRHDLPARCQKPKRHFAKYSLKVGASLVLQGWPERMGPATSCT